MKSVSSAATSVAMLLVLCSIPASQALAQDPALTNHSTSKKRDSDNVQALNAITVTATRRSSNILDTPGVVSVISRSELDERQVNDTLDLIRYQPGISINRQTSAVDPFGNLGSFTIRGVGGNRVKIQVDGARVQEQIQDGNRSFIDLSTLKSVEIVRGPGTVLWGADALGGVVSYQTLDPSDLLDYTDKGWASQVSTNFDSLNNGFSQSLIFASQLSPTWQGLLMYSHTKAHEAKLRKARADGGIWGCPRGEDAIRCDTLNPLSAETHSAIGKLVWTPDSAHEIKLTAELYDSNSRIRQLYDYGRQSSGAFNGDHIRKQDQSRYRFAIQHDWEINSTWLDYARWQLSYSPQQRKTTADKYQRSAVGVGTTTQDLMKWEEDFYQYDLQLGSSTRLLGADHVLTYGLQGDVAKANYLRSTDTFNHNTGQRTFAEASGFANATTLRNDIYVQDEMSWSDGRFVLTPGVRWANYRIKPSVRDTYDAVPGKEPRTLNSHRFVPQVGALLRLDDSHSVYAKYAEGFKMPTAQQLYSSNVYPTMVISPNPDLKPEKVRSYEIGFRGQYDDLQYLDSASYSVGLFKSDYKNFIQNFYNIPGTNHYTYQNLSEVTIWGIEAFGELAFNRNWSLMGSLSWQQGDQRADPGADKEAYVRVPPLTAVAGIKWRKPELGLETEVIGTFAKRPSRIKNASEVFTPAGYGIVDTYLNWTPPALRKGDGQYVTFSLGVTNVFDRRYFSWPMFTTYATSATAGVAAQNPLELQTSPGRVFKLGAVIRF